MMLTLELPDDVYNRLDLLSLSTGRTMQFYVREAVLEYLDDVEDRYLSMSRLEDEAVFEVEGRLDEY